MSNLNVNIDAAAVISQNEQETYVPKKKTEFNVKNYLQARLGSDETTKKITIRLLPLTMLPVIPLLSILQQMEQ